MILLSPGQFWPVVWCAFRRLYNFMFMVVLAFLGRRFITLWMSGLILNRVGRIVRMV